MTGPNTTPPPQEIPTPNVPLPMPGNPARDVPVPQETDMQATHEFGGRRGLDPTRYTDWEKDGKCVDF